MQEKKKYDTLVRVLDSLRKEATNGHEARYCPDESDTEKINQARARAYIHLFLKVKFGVLDFMDREHQTTDDGYDGGIDGYHIDKENRRIYLIQSKFRTTDRNFSSKNIELTELLSMDIERITEGNEADEAGNRYNGKIQRFQREIREIDDIGRYKYSVIILANVDKGVSSSHLKRIIGNHPIEIIDHEACYNHLVFPVVCGTHFNASDLNINVDLSNKSAGAKISYTVQTKVSACEITVLFVPIIEIAKLMHTYRNSVLKHNPRSYLEFEGRKVNAAINQTVYDKTTNEFALFNNGITLLSDETNINERIGKKSKAQLTLKNPQIINGGQTSYTLSRIYAIEGGARSEELFKDKEVLVKVITLAEGSTDEAKAELIDSISGATNLQTPVNGPDRLSNNSIHLNLQSVLFERYGLLYERKRGEFADGVFSKYVDTNDIIERNLFFRLYYASNGEIARARGKKLFASSDLTADDISDFNRLDRFFFAWKSYQALERDPMEKIRTNTFAKIRAFSLLHYSGQPIEKFDELIASKLSSFQRRWTGLASKLPSDQSMRSFTADPVTGVLKANPTFRFTEWYDSSQFDDDVRRFLGSIDDHVID